MTVLTCFLEANLDTEPAIFDDFQFHDATLDGLDQTDSAMILGLEGVGARHELDVRGEPILMNISLAVQNYDSIRYKGDDVQTLTMIAEDATILSLEHASSGLEINLLWHVVPRSIVPAEILFSGDQVKVDLISQERMFKE